MKRKQEDEDGYQDRTLILDSDEDEELVELESEAPSAFMQKMQAEMKKPPTPLPVVSVWRESSWLQSQIYLLCHQRYNYLFPEN